MSTLGNGIASISDIYTNFNVKLFGEHNYCPKYSQIIQDKRLMINGNYENNQLVLYQDIFKNSQYIVLWVSDWKDWLESKEKQGQNDGIWAFKFGDKILDFCEDTNYPSSHLCYFDSEPIKTNEDVIIGTVEQWQNLLNYVDGEWDGVKLHGYDSGKDINFIDNFDELYTSIKDYCTKGRDVSVCFTSSNTSTNSGSTSSNTGVTLLTATIPIYWVEYSDGSINEIDTYAVCKIESYGNNFLSPQYHIVGGYNNGNNLGENQYLGDITFSYKKEDITNKVFVAFSLNDNTTSNNNTICVEEFKNGTWVKISNDYAWGDDVFSADSSSFINQKWSLSNDLKTDPSYAIRLRFN